MRDDWMPPGTKVCPDPDCDGPPLFPASDAPTRNIDRLVTWFCPTCNRPMVRVEEAGAAWLAEKIGDAP